MNETIYDKIRRGLYNNIIPYNYEPEKVHDDMTIRQARELEERNKKEKIEYRRKYNEESIRLEKIFHRDLALEFKVYFHPKEQKLYDIARGDGRSLEEIAYNYEEMVELIKN